MRLRARWLNDDERTSLANLASMISYHPQEMLYQQETPILGLYFICTGLAKVARRTLQGKSRLIALVSDGGVPPYLFSRGGHITYCAALKPTQVAFIERAAFRGWLERHPKAALSLLERVSNEVGEAWTEWTRGEYYMGVTQKLACRLLEAARRFGLPQASGAVLIDLPLTHQDWADWIGHSRERTNDVFCDWQRRGIVALKRHQVLILREDLLHKWASE